MAKAILRNKLEKDRSYLENEKWREGNLSISLQSQPTSAYLEKDKRVALEWSFRQLGSSSAQFTNDANSVY